MALNIYCRLHPLLWGLCVLNPKHRWHPSCSGGGGLAVGCSLLSPSFAVSLPSPFPTVFRVCCRACSWRGVASPVLTSRCSACACVELCSACPVGTGRLGFSLPPAEGRARLGVYAHVHTHRPLSCSLRYRPVWRCAFCQKAVAKS